MSFISQRIIILLYLRRIFIKPVTMKKLIALLAICGFALSFVACGKKAEPAAEAVDSTATEEVVVDSASDMAPDSAAADTVAH